MRYYDWLSGITAGGSKARVIGRNTRWKRDNKKNFKNHIIGSIITSSVGCTLSPREPETRREWECKWKHSPRLGCCLVSSRFFSGSRCLSQRVSYLTWLSPLIFDSFFFHSAFPGGLRAHSDSLQSHTRTVSSRVTLARESRQMYSARMYSRHKDFLLVKICK